MVLSIPTRQTRLYCSRMFYLVFLYILTWKIVCILKEYIINTKYENKKKQLIILATYQAVIVDIK